MNPSATRDSTDKIRFLNSRCFFEYFYNYDITVARHDYEFNEFFGVFLFNADQTLQMESPSAQDRLIEAQEDFTSAESTSETTTASTEEPSTVTGAESTERDEDVGCSMTTAEEVDNVINVRESIDNEETFVSVESCEASLASLETSNDSSTDEGQLDFSDMGLKLGKNEKRSEDEDVDVKSNVEVKSNELIVEQDCLEAVSTPTSTSTSTTMLTICTTTQTTASTAMPTSSSTSSSSSSPSPSPSSSPSPSPSPSSSPLPSPSPSPSPSSSMIQCVEKQTEYCKTSDGEFITSSPICRKRPASDFLPINAEIKRIGVEMPENESNQVRRISPVLVSLRERTLGEISLSSDSCLFDNDVGSRCIPRNNRILDDLLTSTNCRLSTSASLDDSFQTDHDTEAIDCTDTAERRICRVATSLEGECTNSSVEEALAEQSEKLEYPDPFIDEDSCCSLSRDSPERNLKKCQEPKQCEEPIDDECSCNDAMPANDACAIAHDETSNELIKNSLPNLIVKVEQIDLSRYLAAERKDKKRMVIVPKRKQKKSSECKEDAGDVDVRTDPKESLHCFVPLCTYTSESDQKTESQDQEKQVDSVVVSTLQTAQEKLESSFTTPIKECKVLLQRITLPKAVRTTTPIQTVDKEETAPRAIIEKLAEDEEVVFSFPLPSSTNLQSLNNLDSIETARPSSPEELLESTTDVPEAIDTETETETGSDSSEMSSMTNVRLGGCDDDAASDQISCQESESICCVDINPEIISRLEPERPEAFTEDSAESLALATGARDEVRSDGSDSGLGSEIPGDPGPAPVPESDSETSFLDRIPDDILSDKEKGN